MTTDRLKATIEKQSDWVKVLPTIAWVHHSTTLPAQCKEVETDIRQISDLDLTQVEQIVSEVEDINFEVLMGIRDGIFNDTQRNIKATQKRQKRNYDKRHGEEGEELNIGDLVVKEEQKNKSRKGGKLEKVREDKLFVIEEILPNGNVTLRNVELNLLEPFSIPMKYIKKIKICKTPPKKYRNEMVSTMTHTTISNLTTTMDIADSSYTYETDTHMNTTETQTTTVTANTTEISQLKNQKCRVEEEVHAK